MLKHDNDKKVIKNAFTSML